MPALLKNKPIGLIKQGNSKQKANLIVDITKIVAYGNYIKIYAKTIEMVIQIAFWPIIKTLRKP